MKTNPQKAPSTGTVTFGQLVQGSTEDSPTPTTLAEAYRKALDDEFPSLVLDQGQADRVGRFMQNLRLGGGAGIPLTCTGSSCAYNQNCPLYAEKTGPAVQVQDPDDPSGQTLMWFQPTKAPVGDSCPIEATVMMDERVRLSELVDEAASSTIALRYINEMVQIRQLEWRCQMLLSYDEHPVLMDVVAAVSPTGSVYYRKEISPLIDLLDKLSKRRSQMMKEAVWSPESEYKRKAALGDKVTESMSRAQSERRKKLREAEQTPAFQEIPEHVLTDTFPTDSPQEYKKPQVPEDNSEKGKDSAS